MIDYNSDIVRRIIDNQPYLSVVLYSASYLFFRKIVRKHFYIKGKDWHYVLAWFIFLFVGIDYLILRLLLKIEFRTILHEDFSYAIIVIMLDYLLVAKRNFDSFIVKKKYDSYKLQLFTLYQKLRIFYLLTLIFRSPLLLIPYGFMLFFIFETRYLSEDIQSKVNSVKINGYELKSCNTRFFFEDINEFRLTKDIPYTPFQKIYYELKTSIDSKLEKEDNAKLSKNEIFIHDLGESSTNDLYIKNDLWNHLSFALKSDSAYTKKFPKNQKWHFYFIENNLSPYIFYSPNEETEDRLNNYATLDTSKILIIEIPSRRITLIRKRSF